MTGADRTDLVDEVVRTLMTRLRNPDVLVYGSVLRDDFRPSSDVDVFVMDHGEGPPRRFDIAGRDQTASINLASERVVLDDAVRHTYGGYYAAKFALPVLPLSRCSGALVERSRELLLRARRSCTSPEQAAVDLFPAYRAFTAAKGKATLGPLTDRERRMLHRFRAEGERMHATDPAGWWRGYKRRAGIPESWD
ncbi:nucleotidyltransferase family protein [Actinoplanes solisilvae]|uniref:nucleotidyltransferase family protein n=1 Tax=Actinoplanes solisilvae TaxID=2486853 RepID=UPI000FD847E4|nr:nucleotidyltransferase domain-containing protein [Actinoplanes solisilvae]